MRGPWWLTKTRAAKTLSNGLVSITCHRTNLRYIQTMPVGTGLRYKNATLMFLIYAVIFAPPSLHLPGGGRCTPPTAPEITDVVDVVQRAAHVARSGRRTQFFWDAVRPLLYVQARRTAAWASAVPVRPARTRERLEAEEG